MSGRSLRERRAPRRFGEEDGHQEQTGSSSPSQPQDSFDEEESSCWRSHTERGRNYICAGGQSSIRAANGTSDAPRSRSPHRQEAWNTQAEPDTINPHPPRFMPKRRPGVQPPFSSSTQTPGEIFSYFFDTEVLKVLCANTNKNAKKKLEMGKKFAWIDITPHELRKYLGMLLFMSVCKLPKISDFWRKNTIFHVSFPASVMSRDRFAAINTNLHMSDPEQDAINEQKRGTEGYDPLHKVNSLLTMIRNHCKSLYHPKQHISVDERRFATKARLKRKQYMKTKPSKWGLKFVVLADVNGYIVDYRLHTGRSSCASEKGFSFDVVTELVKKDYLGSGYIVYCDSFYTSPPLFRHLSQQGFGACGTYSQGRAGVPTTKENALDKRSKRGTIRWIREDDLLFVKWMDTREVSMCTTVHPVYTGETVLRWQKNSDGHSQRVPVPRPTAVAEYNKYTGGADTSYQVHRRTQRWSMTVFQHLLDIAVTNSFVVHKELSVMQRHKPMTRQAFQEELCATLFGVPLASPPQPPNHGHFPVPTNKNESTDKRQKASMGRKQCTLCKKSTPWKCGECRVGLCLQLDRNCFSIFHNSKNTCTYEEFLLSETPSLHLDEFESCKSKV